MLSRLLCSRLGLKLFRLMENVKVDFVSVLNKLQTIFEESSPIYPGTVLAGIHLENCKSPFNFVTLYQYHQH